MFLVSLEEVKKVLASNESLERLEGLNKANMKKELCDILDTKVSRAIDIDNIVKDFQDKKDYCLKRKGDNFFNISARCYGRILGTIKKYSDVDLGIKDKE